MARHTIRIRGKNNGWLIWLAVAVFVLFTVSGFFKNLLTKFGLLKSADDEAWSKAMEDGRISVVNGAVKSIAEQYAKQPPTKSDAEWLAIADTIYGDLRVHLDQNDSDAAYQIARVKNDSDCYKLVQAFGNRSIYAFGIPYKSMTLPQFLASEVPAASIQTVNDNLARKGIKFRW